jgi:ATP-dependent exoDNAse (exonuclease V) alpha subunit
LEFNEIVKESSVSRVLVIVDEASMVGTKLKEHLMQFIGRSRSKVLFVGDREQLEPVNDQWGVDLLNPTAALTKVHRQADGSNLLDFVTLIREGRIKEFQKYGADVCSYKPVTEAILRWFWQSTPFTGDRIVLTYTNRLRVGQNNIARRALGFAGGPVLQRGEVVMSFANRGPLVNGEIMMVVDELVEVASDDPGYFFAQLLRRSGLQLIQATLGASLDADAPNFRVYLLTNLFGMLPEKRSEVWSDIGNLIKLETGGGASIRFGKLQISDGSGGNPLIQSIDYVFKNLVDVDYGYACTVHKAQGSQWARVVVLLEYALNKAEGGIDFRRRWLYTAATRAEKSLILGILGG